MLELTKILENPTITELYREHGIPHYDEGSGDLEAVTVTEKIELSNSEIGTVGTYVIDGRLHVEANHRVRPHYARGRMSRPGILEANYRSEPIIFNSVNSITSLIKSATYEPGHDGPLDPDTARITKQAHRAIMGIEGGFGRFLTNASTCVKIGFSVFEHVWDPDGWITGIKFREQSTVERWLFDNRGQDLVGAEFCVSGDITCNYVLTAGPNFSVSKLGLITVHGSGNNVEGVSPVRVCVGLRALKELILNCLGLSYQKYGVPIFQVVSEVANLASQIPGGAESAAEIQKILNQIANLQASQGAAIRVPAGSRIEVASPTNTMPDIRPILEYLDALMALCFANEGSVLGTGSFGSYALASVADDRFMRSAPVYARAIADYLTDLLHLMIRHHHPDPSKIEIWPRYNYRFSGTQDASRWVEDMSKLIAAQVWTWPEEARHHASVTMGFSESAFDDWSTSMGQPVESTAPSSEPTNTTPSQDGEIDA